MAVMAYAQFQIGHPEDQKSGHMSHHRFAIPGILFGWIFAVAAPTLGLAQEPAKAEPKKVEAKKPEADPKKPPGNELKREYDLVYTKTGGTDLKLDLVRPAGDGEPLATILVIHGGGWSGGNKESNRRFLDMLAERGFVAVSPQYRLVPKAIFPAQVHELKAAIRWLKSNSTKYRIDPERMGAMGFSAGGHLALMLGVTDQKDGLEGDLQPQGPNTRIRAVVNYFGPTDLDADDIPTISRPLVDAFLGGPLKDKKKEASQASPLDFISENDAVILTFQGTKDPLVPHSQAIKLAEAMTAKKVNGRVELYVGDGHGWEGIEKTISEAADFLESSLRKAETGGRRRRNF